MLPIVDLRSDTVTQPTADMRNAMAATPLGDDVFVMIRALTACRKK